MKYAAFGQFAKYLYTALIIISISLVPGTHARVNNSILDSTASTKAFAVEKAQVLTDNDRALDAKLAAIESAHKSIDLIYYIFADDYSSSKFARKLIEAADRGVKVRILLDYLTNLTRVDLLLALDSHQNIDIKLYNKPTHRILRDAVFVTSACEDGYDNCRAKKDQKSRYLLNNGNGTDFISRLFLTGLYSKTIDLAKVSILEGQKFDPAALQSSTETSPEDMKKLKELGQLIYKAKVKGEVSSSLKLWLAFQMYGEQVKPIYNMITGTLPLDSESKSSKDWMYLSDYTHHKYLLADKKHFIIGGRNVEDSYHVKNNDMHQGDDKKYIFMDTDFAATVDSKTGESINSTFERLWGFNNMTADMNEVDDVMELDAIGRPDLAAQAVMSCKEAKILATCAEDTFNSLMKENAQSRSERIASKLDAMKKLAADFDRLHKTELLTEDVVNDTMGLLSAADLATSKIYYIENLPFSRAKPNKRQYGAGTSSDKAANKNIHELLNRGLDQACTDSLKAKKKMNVVLHNAYFFPSPNVLRKFGEMMTGKKNCKYVTVKIITNSYETTDLFPVNAFASTQLKAIFEMQAKIQNSKKRDFRKAAKRAAQFEYYEYKKDPKGKLKSLHSKVSLLGNDIIIGSANLDMRSYAMDTNNGVYIKGAKDLVTSYNKYISDLIAGRLKDKGVVNRTAEFMNLEVTKDEFVAHQLQIMKYAISEFSPKGAELFVDGDLEGETAAQKATRLQRRAYLKQFGTDTLNLVYDATRASLWPATDRNKRKRLENTVLELLGTI